MAKIDSVDIHNFDDTLLRQIEIVKSANISEEDRKLILKFDEYMTIEERLSVPRRLRCMGILRMISEEYLRGDFKVAKIDTIKAAVAKIEANPKYSAWTKASYRALIKKFYRWMAFGNDKMQGYPPIVRWIHSRPNRNEVKRIGASDILTREEVEQLINAAEGVRDKAFISILYESCGRIGEIGGAKIKDVSVDPNGFVIDVRNSKTDQRSVFVIKSAPLLVAWLNIHPTKDNPNAPLWMSRTKYSNCKNPKEEMSYPALRAIIIRALERTNIKKPVHPHLFRHTRTTHLLEDGVPEAIVKQMRGDSPGSNVIGEYSHLISANTKHHLLKLYGIEKKEDTEKNKMIECPRCGKPNALDRDFCYKCWLPLNEKAVIAQQDLQMRGERLRSTNSELKDDRIERLEKEILKLKEHNRRR